jgi:hypothetical protein
VSRLAKRDVEALLDLVDTEPVAILTRLLQKVLDRPGASWTELVAACPLDEATKVRLLDCEPDALYDLTALLNECRGFEP